MGDLRSGQNFFGSQHAKHCCYVRVGQLALRFAACQKQVEQVVVGQVHQLLQTCRVGDGELGLMSPEKTLDEKIVLEQATAAAPLQSAEIGRMQDSVQGKAFNRLSART